MALKDMTANTQVIKYGFSIGHATENIKPGQWVHSHNMVTNLSGQEEYSYNPDITEVTPIPIATFAGYLRRDGSAAIQNEIWIIPAVGCVNDVAKALVQENQDWCREVLMDFMPIRIPLVVPKPAMTTHRQESC